MASLRKPIPIVIPPKKNTVLTNIHNPPIPIIRPINIEHKHGLMDKLFHLLHIGNYDMETEPVIPSTHTCQMNKGGKVLFTPKSFDPEDIPDEVIDNMCNFHLNGLTGKAKIRHIIDGDTYDLFMYIPLSNLSVTQKVIKYKKEYEVTPILTQNDDAGFFGLFRCRSFGYDSAEKITERGQVAKQVFIQKLESLQPPNVVYYKAGGYDKYGRLLVELFEDASMHISINQYMVNYRDPKWGNITLEYSGGTKDQKFKSEEAAARLQSHDKNEAKNSSIAPYKGKNTVVRDIPVIPIKFPSHQPPTVPINSLTNNISPLPERKKKGILHIFGL
jgi:hypothetical protein